MILYVLYKFYTINGHHECHAQHEKENGIINIFKHLSDGESQT